MNRYISLMEAVKLKEGLKVAMEYSSECNLYLQEQKPWELAKKDPARCAQVVHTGLNVLYFLCVILEPFMPSFSAKVYEQLAIKREIKHETAIAQIVAKQSLIGEFVVGGHTIGTPEPIFREIKPEEVQAWREKFNGKK